MSTKLFWNTFLATALMAFTLSAAPSRKATSLPAAYPPKAADMCASYTGQRLYAGYDYKGDSAFVVFKSNAGRHAVPLCSMPGPFHEMGGVALDADDNLWVSFQNIPALALYPHKSNNNGPASQTIEGPNTLLLPQEGSPTVGIAVDAGGDIWAPNANSSGEAWLTEFSATANGNVPPIGTIGYGDGGKSEGLRGATAVAFDSQGRLFVAIAFGFIQIFDPPFSDTSVPIATWTLPNDHSAWYLTFDHNGNLIVAGSSSIDVFKAGYASGGTPTSSFTVRDNIYGVTVDAKNHVYVSDVVRRAICVLKALPTSYSPIRIITSSLFKDPPESLVVGN